MSGASDMFMGLGAEGDTADALRRLSLKAPSDL
jgi:hypothetical protein